MKNIIYFFLTLTSILFLSCTVDSEVVEPKGDITFVQKTLSFLDNLTEKYPPSDVRLILRKSEEGVVQASFQLIGDSREKAFETQKNKRMTYGSDGIQDCSSFPGDCDILIDRFLQQKKVAVITPAKCDGIDGGYCVTRVNWDLGPVIAGASEDARISDSEVSDGMSPGRPADLKREVKVEQKFPDLTNPEILADLKRMVKKHLDEVFKLNAKN